MSQFHLYLERSSFKGNITYKHQGNCIIQINTFSQYYDESPYCARNQIGALVYDCSLVFSSLVHGYSLSHIRQKVFDQKLEDLAKQAFACKRLEEIGKAEPLDSWCSIDGVRPAPSDAAGFLAQEQAYIPDINDGVRVNITPVRKAGVLTADVIAKKDLEKVIADRVEWLTDERRWCREGKLPKCGWW